MQKQILHNQSVFDCLLQQTGSFKRLAEFVTTNNSSMTDELKAGDVYYFPPVDDSDMYDYFKAKEVVPATAITDLAINEIESLGIGAMIIETNFIVR